MSESPARWSDSVEFCFEELARRIEDCRDGRAQGIFGVDLGDLPGPASELSRRALAAKTLLLARGAPLARPDRWWSLASAAFRVAMVGDAGALATVRDADADLFSDLTELCAAADSRSGVEATDYDALAECIKFCEEAGRDTQTRRAARDIGVPNLLHLGRVLVARAVSSFSADPASIRDPQAFINRALSELADGAARGEAALRVGGLLDDRGHLRSTLSCWNREVAADAAQAAYMRAHQNADAILKADRPANYAARLARNAGLSELRRFEMKLSQVPVDEETLALPETEVSPEAAVELLDQSLRTVLQRLGRAIDWRSMRRGWNLSIASIVFEADETQVKAAAQLVADIENARGFSSSCTGEHALGRLVWALAHLANPTAFPRHLTGRDTTPMQRVNRFVRRVCPPSALRELAS